PRTRGRLSRADALSNAARRCRCRTTRRRCPSTAAGSREGRARSRRNVASARARRRRTTRDGCAGSSRRGSFGALDGGPDFLAVRDLELGAIGIAQERPVADRVARIDRTERETAIGARLLGEAGDLLARRAADGDVGETAERGRGET